MRDLSILIGQLSDDLSELFRCGNSSFIFSDCSRIGDRRTSAAERQVFLFHPDEDEMEPLTEQMDGLRQTMSRYQLALILTEKKIYSLHSVKIPVRAEFFVLMLEVVIELKCDKVSYLGFITVSRIEFE